MISLVHVLVHTMYEFNYILHKYIIVGIVFLRLKASTVFGTCEKRIRFLRSMWI